VNALCPSAFEGFCLTDSPADPLLIDLALNLLTQITASPPQERTAIRQQVTPRRVLLAGYRSHPHVGGQGIYLSALATALVGLGHHVEVVSGPPYPDLPPSIVLHRLPSLDLFSVPNALAAFRWSFVCTPGHMSEWLLHNSGAFGEPRAFFDRLAHWWRHHHARYDIIHDNQGLGAGLLKLKPAVPVVATLHHPITVDLDYALALEKSASRRFWLKRWHGFVGMQAKVARRLPHLITVSHASAERIARDFKVDPARITTAFNGIDHSAFCAASTPLREEGLIVATASSDLPLKGVDVLIAAFAELAKENQTARLCLVGRLRDGPVRDAIELAGLGPRLEVRTGLSRAELVSLYQRASLVVVPSRFEGFGFPAAEAMACGAPVVVAAGGALPEVVGDAGLVVPINDAPALKGAMARVLADPELQAAMAAKSLARAAHTFSWDAHARAVSAVYDQVLGAC
jgi:glycosyltransferase involved in cell wall biosynthesis